MIKPRIEYLQTKQLVGKRQIMSVVNNKTVELWEGFLSERSLIKHSLTEDLISMQVYEPSYFQSFNPQAEFEKWATVEVSTLEELPSKMEAFILEEGLYAVFDYKGSSLDSRIFQYIYSDWLPNSEYQLDNRPHFEVLGEKYKNADLSSEEEIWIPIYKK